MLYATRQSFVAIPPCDVSKYMGGQIDRKGFTHSGIEDRYADTNAHRASFEFPSNVLVSNVFACPEFT